jgi:HKD family nuclease
MMVLQPSVKGEGILLNHLRTSQKKSKITGQLHLNFVNAQLATLLYGLGRIVKDLLKVLSKRFRLRSYIRHQEKTHFTMSLNSSLVP